MNNDDDYDSLDYTASEEVWGLDQDHSKKLKEKSPMRYLDLSSLRVQNVGQKILDSALESSKEQYASIDSLWRIFIEHIEAYAFAEEISRQIEYVKVELEAEIKKDFYPQLEKKAYEDVKKEVRASVEKDLIAEMRSNLAPLVQNAITRQLEKEFEISLRPIIAEKLKRELEPEVRNQLKQEMLGDPKITEQVHAELKKRILGL